jgi:phosphate uptake regulator
LENISPHITSLIKELALSKEAIPLHQEKLQAAEQNLKITSETLEEEIIKHREAVNQLNIGIKEKYIGLKSNQ